jgi:hypothetical protein
LSALPLQPTVGSTTEGLLRTARSMRFLYLLLVNFVVPDYSSMSS